VRDGNPVIDIDDQGHPIAASSTVTSKSPFDRTQKGGIKTTSTVDVPVADNRLAAASSPADWKPVEVNLRPRQQVLQQIDLTLEELWQANRIEPAFGWSSAVVTRFPRLMAESAAASNKVWLK
jgi:hypothetical protein